MLPHPYDAPSCGEQRLVCLTIPLDVPVELRCPPGSVVDRAGAVRRTPVPKAAVNKHGYSSVAEDDVGAAAKTWKDLSVDAVTEAEPV